MTTNKNKHYKGRLERQNNKKNLSDKISHFLETFHLNVGKTVYFCEAICTDKDGFNRHFTTFSSTEFILESFGARISGARMSFRGEKLDYEIGLDCLISLEEEENKTIFLEAYCKEVYRKTTLQIIDENIN